jgi:hypothetical protein
MLPICPVASENPIGTVCRSIRRGSVSGSGKGIQLTFLVRRFRGGKPADSGSFLEVINRQKTGSET